MDFWSTTGAGTQAAIEFAALVIEIIAIVVIIEWLRKRREDQQLEGVRRRLGGKIIDDISELTRCFAVLAVSEDPATWTAHQAISLDIGARILRELDDAIATHYMNVTLISLFGRARQYVETSTNHLKEPVVIATWADNEPVSRRSRDIGVNAYERLVPLHDELMETMFPGDNVKKLAWRGIDRVASYALFKSE